MQKLRPDWNGDLNHTRGVEKFGIGSKGPK